MRLGHAFLANYVEENNGLLYVSGGLWDTVWVPPGQPALWRGALFVRLLAERSECGRPHSVEIALDDEDGVRTSSAIVALTPMLPPNHPVGWDVPVNVIMQNPGSALPKLGRYRFVVTADNVFLGEVPFRAESSANKPDQPGAAQVIPPGN